MPKPNPPQNRNNTNGTSNRYAKFTKTAPQTKIAWTQVSGRAIAELVGAITASGDAVTFGCTSDGGALVITILSGADRHKLYFSSIEEFHAQAPDLIEAALMPMA